MTLQVVLWLALLVFAVGCFWHVARFRVENGIRSGSSRKGLTVWVLAGATVTMGLLVDLFIYFNPPPPMH